MRPPYVYWHPSKGGNDILHAERGWPFRYLDVQQGVPKGDATQLIHDGWPRNSGLPAVTHAGKLLADIAVTILVTYGLLYAALRGAIVPRRRRVGGLTAVDAARRQACVLRVRVIPTVLLMLLGVAGLVIASAAFLRLARQWVDVFLSDYSFEYVFSPIGFLGLCESCLAILASALLLAAAKACWKSAVSRMWILLAAASAVAFILFLVLRVDVYTEWGYYLSPLFADNR